MQAVCRVPVLGYGIRAKTDVTVAKLVCDASGSRFEILPRSETAADPASASGRVQRAECARRGGRRDQPGTPRMKRL